MTNEQRLLSIIEHNRAAEQPIRNGEELAASFFCPHRAKVSAAQCLITLRRNREACRRYGWNPAKADANWLAQAQAHRRVAQPLLPTIDATPLHKSIAKLDGFLIEFGGAV